MFICTAPLKGSGGAPHDFPAGKKQNLGIGIEFNSVFKIQSRV